ncbi:MAG: PhoH family protein [Pseudomonadota bacterium]
MKTFVLDTSILLHNPRSIYVFEENQVIIPLAVIEEIDNQKKRQDEIGRNAREVCRLLDQLRTSGPLAEGVPLPGGGGLRVEVNHCNFDQLPDAPNLLDARKPDNRILAVALNLARENKTERVVLVSKDLNLRVKADVLGLTAEDLVNDKVDFRRLYSGQADVALGEDELNHFYLKKELPLNGHGLHPHQFAVLKCAANPSLSGLARNVNSVLSPLAAQSLPDCFGLKPRNKEQMFALDLLLDERVRVVTLAGGAGTGKTLLALAAGLELVLEKNAYAKLLITRPVIPLDGQDIGFLPGDKKEKIRPWMQPIFDNMDYLFRFSPLRGIQGKGASKPGQGRDNIVEIENYLTFAGCIELEALSYIRGRSLARQFILVDEAQNCTAHTIKTLLTRVGEGSKIVFTGDIHQIDHPYLDSASNGFTIMIEKIKESTLSGHVNLLKGERSQVAELGANLL